MTTIDTDRFSAYSGRRGRPTKDVSENKNAILDMFLAGVQLKVDETIRDSTAEAVQVIVDHVAKLREDMEKYKTIQVLTERGKKEVRGLAHKQFETLLKVAATGFPTMLVGPAGSGKTYAAEQVARTLELPFHSISVGSQTSKSDLIGYMHATGGYVTTQFREAYEHGGIFLMDEIDAGNSNVLIILNSALAGTACPFPDVAEGMIDRHPDFLFIATANTYGTGASRQYVGRNQIDAATLDRFITIDWDIDEVLEQQTVDHLEHGKKWFTTVKQVREYINKQSIRVIVSPRATMKGANLLEQGFPVGKVIEMTILPTAPADQRKPLTDQATSFWNNA